jgi:hypothetical protein
MLVVSRKLRCVARTTGASAESSLTPLAPDRPRLLCVHQVLPLCPPDGPDPAYCGRPAAGHQEQRPRRQRSLLARPPLGLPAACHRLRESSTSPRSTAAAPRSRAKLTRSSRSCASNYSSCTSRKHPSSAKTFLHQLPSACPLQTHLLSSLGDLRCCQRSRSSEATSSHPSARLTNPSRSPHLRPTPPNLPAHAQDLAHLLVDSLLATKLITRETVSTPLAASISFPRLALAFFKESSFGYSLSMLDRQGS